MKYVAIHDARGELDALIVSPDDAPPGMVAVEAGFSASPIVDMDLKLDVADPASLESVAERLAEFRVEPTVAARLARKG